MVRVRHKGMVRVWLGYDIKSEEDIRFPHARKIHLRRW